MTTIDILDEQRTVFVVGVENEDLRWRRHGETVRRSGTQRCEPLAVFSVGHYLLVWNQSPLMQGKLNNAG